MLLWWLGSELIIVWFFHFIYIYWDVDVLVYFGIMKCYCLVDLLDIRICGRWLWSTGYYISVFDSVKCITIWSSLCTSLNWWAFLGAPTISFNSRTDLSSTHLMNFFFGRAYLRLDGDFDASWFVRDIRICQNPCWLLSKVWVSHCWSMLQSEYGNDFTWSVIAIGTIN